MSKQEYGLAERILGLVLHAWAFWLEVATIKLMWQWFVTREFGLRALSWPQACGLSTLLSFATVGAYGVRKACDTWNDDPSPSPPWAYGLVMTAACTLVLIVGAACAAAQGVL